MSAEPLAEQAMTRVLELLGGMSGTRFWGGPYVTPPVVLRELRQPDQVNQCPTICVKEESGSEFHAAAPLEAAGTQLAITDHFQLVIYGHVKRDLNVSESLWLLRLREDIRLTLLADVTLGGLARGLNFGTEEVDGGLLEPRALVVMPVTLILDSTYTVN